MTETPIDFIAGGGPIVIRTTFPANGTVEELTSEEHKMIPCNVYRIQLVFPSGCVQLCHVGIYQNERKLFPLTPDEWLDGNNEVINFETDINVETGETWSLRGYNADDTYDHTITARIYIKSIDYQDMRTSILTLINEVRNLAIEFKRFSDLWTTPTKEVSSDQKTTEEE